MCPPPALAFASGLSLPFGAAGCCRLPDGGRPGRRFSDSDPLRVLYDFVDSQGPSGLVAPGAFQLVTSFPRRVLGAEALSTSLATLGLVAGGQEVLIVEPHAALEPDSNTVLG